MRTRCTVERVECSPLPVTGDRPYSLQSPASIMVWLTRTYTDGRAERAMLEICLQEGFRTDGASTSWPISRIVPPWRVNDILFFGKDTSHITHVAICCSSRGQYVEAGGGGSKCKSPETSTGMVRVRPLGSRKDLVAALCEP